MLSLVQDGINLQGSVRLNIDPYHPPDRDVGDARLSDQKLTAVLTRVGLWPTVVAGGGLDADMSQVNFSQGQMQLLAIARAMLRRDYTLPKIVLIDEATSNMDRDTDEAMQALFAEVFAEPTVLMISHRLDAFEKMEKVIKLGTGKIEEVLVRDLSADRVKE
jgi:ABC-type multidrug transport system fused ATPase/permease subunit